MIAIIRLAVVGFILLSIAYLLISIYSRSVRREKLEKGWDANPPAGAGDAGADRPILRQGMRAYEHGLRKKLIWLVYIIPTIAIVVIVYFRELAVGERLCRVT
jgi:hypothetical protein